MKKFLRSLTKRLGYNIHKIVPPSAAPEVVSIIKTSKDLVSKFSPDLSILEGPFKGMKYPSLEITELALAPKFFGTYESQLHSLLETIAATEYSDILDVGCAEGYYAVGLARRSPKSTIHCYDINELDIQFCKKMACLNGVSNLTFNDFCSPETLINFNHRGRTLIFCDCEGYEIELFTQDVINSFSRVDVLVELHDLINPAISSTLLNRFNATHNALIIDNSPTLAVNQFNASINLLNPEDRAFALSEHRGGPHQRRFMEWAFFTAKSDGH